MAYEGEDYMQFQFDGWQVETNLTDFRLESVSDADDVLFASGRVRGHLLPGKAPFNSLAVNWKKIWAAVLDPPKETDDAP